MIYNDILRRFWERIHWREPAAVTFAT